jgi:hypothetical protein
MRFSFVRSLLVAAALLLLGSPMAFANCNPGDFQCQGGYRYVCKCWTTTGCQYESAGGYCHHDDSDSTSVMGASLRLLTRRNIQQTALVCSAHYEGSVSKICFGH